MLAAVLLLATGACSGEDDSAPGGAHASAPAAAPDPSGAWLRDATVELGLDFRHEAGARGALHLPEIMGSGLALFDADGDGDLDLYLAQANASLAGPGRVDGSLNALYLQQADGRFAVATASGLEDGGYGTGVAVGDVDNDGDLDVYVANYGPDRLYLNEGGARFREASRAAGIDVGGWSSSVTLCDLDEDGWLDVYVTRYVVYDPAKSCFDAAGRRDYCSPDVFAREHDVLLRNLGGGRFTDVSVKAGLAAAAGPGLGVVCEELTGDGLPDVYVANDGAANQLWVNLGDFTFRDEAALRGVAYNVDGEAEAGMGLLAADLDGDLAADLFLTHLRDETNTLYRSLGGDRGFTDVSGPSGVGPPSQPLTGFGTAAVDLELDGDLDLLAVNGRVLRGEVLAGSRLPEPWTAYAEPNLLYLNDGNGRFTVDGRRCGTFCSDHEITRGLAAGDIDGDGDVDLVLSNVQGPARIVLNEAPRQGAWLAVRAIDPELHRDVLGARITVESGGMARTRTLVSGFGYLSASPPLAHFGLPARTVDRLLVDWPGGEREAFSGGEADRVITLVRGAGHAP